MILSNQVRCNRCGDEPFSVSVHDFKSCKCGSITVDGGQEYLRRLGNVHEYTEMSIEITDVAIEAAEKAIQWAKDTHRNNLGILCAVVRALRDNGVTCQTTNT